MGCSKSPIPKTYNYELSRLRQPLPNLLGVIALKPTHVVFLTTDAEDRVRLRLEKLLAARGVGIQHVAIDPCDPAADAYTPAPQPVAGPHTAGQASAVSIAFVTPMRLKHNGALVNTITPPDFLAALARRANALNLLHGSGERAVDETAVVDLAARITPEKPVCVAYTSPATPPASANACSGPD